MKKLLLSIVVVFCITSLPIHSAQAQNRQKAMRYYKKLMEPVSPTKRLTWLYLKEISRGKNMQAIAQQRTELIASLQATKKHVTKDKGYYDDFSMRNQVLHFIDTTLLLVENQCAAFEILEAKLDERYENMKVYVEGKEAVFYSVQRAMKQLVNKQYSFAKQYKIGPAPSIGDKTYQSVVKISEPMRYYNPIFLIFHKVHHQDRVVWKAMKSGDVANFKAQNDLLLNYANEALVAAGKLTPYKDNNSIIVAVTDILKYYQELASRDYPAMLDYYPKKANFDKQKKLINETPEDQQTNAQIDAYNSAARAYNKAAKQFNYLNSSTRKTKKTRLDTWKIRVDNFFDFYLKK